MTGGEHTFSEINHPVGSQNIFYVVFENILEKAGILAKDLITKIVSSDERDQIVLGEYDDIDKVSEIAFGSSWHIENEVFKAWFKEMEDAHKKEKREDDEAKSPYDVGSLKHLLRFITNTLGHPTKRLPGSSKADLHDFITKYYPRYDKVSEIAFGSSWHIENEVFKAWFKEMEDAHKKDKREDDEAKSPYDVGSLKHLLRFITNTLGHPTKRLPGSSKADLHDFITKYYPKSFYCRLQLLFRKILAGQIH
ncbi:putative reverse transcriptase domain-containing protein [Tanacetum coccineum]